MSDRTEGGNPEDDKTMHLRAGSSGPSTFAQKEWAKCLPTIDGALLVLVNSDDDTTRESNHPIKTSEVTPVAGKPVRSLGAKHQRYEKEQCKPRDLRAIY